MRGLVPFPDQRVNPRQILNLAGASLVKNLASFPIGHLAGLIDVAACLVHQVGDPLVGGGPDQCHLLFGRHLNRLLGGSGEP